MELIFSHTRRRDDNIGDDDGQGRGRGIGGMEEEGHILMLAAAAAVIFACHRRRFLFHRIFTP
jgi:hypothetical protein